MESFQPSGASTHRPLQGKEIRIVTLHPGSFDDPVFCTLDYVVLDGPRDDYVAISYTWGDPTQTEDINLDGHAYPVTLNLRSALAYIRNEDEPRRLWIDSLCINQRDMVERSAQIPRMRDVFAFAAEVHIWLGDYGSKYDKLSWKQTFDFYTSLINLNAYPSSSPLIAGIYYGGMGTLLRRPWFQRMWVIQEVAVRDWDKDGENVKFLVGHLNLTWSILGRTFGDLLNLRLFPSGYQELGPGRIEEGNALREIRHIWGIKHHFRQLPIDSVPNNLPQQLGFMLSRLVKSKVTDPRDRIYSLLGLLYGPGKVPDELAPDYSKPVDEVFHAYAAWMLKDGVCIDLLSVNSRQQAGRQCPSWVPDFQGRNQELWHCPVDSNPIRVLQENRVLEIDALTLGIVRTVGNRCEIPTKSNPNPQEVVQNCRPYLHDCETWIQDHAMDLINDSPRTKLSKYFDESYNAFMKDPDDHENFTCGELYDAIFRDSDDLNYTPETFMLNADACMVVPYAEFIVSEFNGFTPFICDNGKLEFYNNKVDVPEPGDVLCLLRGSSKQYILRRAPPDSLGEWIMVGTSYNASEYNYVEPVRDGRPKEEANITYTELWTKNEDKIFKAVIC